MKIDFQRFFLRWPADRQGLSVEFENAVNKLSSSNQNILFNSLIRQGYAPKIAERTYKEFIQLRDIPLNWLNGQEINSAYRCENSLYTLLLVLLGDDYNVGLTTVHNGANISRSCGDGGFDIAVIENGKNVASMLIDVKSGANPNNQHVSFLTEMGCPFYKVLMDSDEEDRFIGLYKTRRDFLQNQVGDITLDQFLANLSDICLHGLYNKELVEQKERIVEKLNKLIS